MEKVKKYLLKCHNKVIKVLKEETQDALIFPHFQSI